MGGVTHFPASRQAYMECFEGGRGVFSRVPPVGPWDYSMSQTQNPGNPGILRYIPDQTGGFSGPKKSRKNPGPGRAGPGRAGRAGPGWAGLGRAGPGRAGPGHAESAGKIFSWPRKNIFGSKKNVSRLDSVLPRNHFLGGFSWFLPPENAFLKLYLPGWPRLGRAGALLGRVRISRLQLGWAGLERVRISRLQLRKSKW